MKKLVLLFTMIFVISFLNFNGVDAQEKSKDIQIMNRARPKELKPIAAPNFIVKTKSNKFMMSLGGYINPIMGVDLGGEMYETAAGISFIPGEIS